MRSATLSNVHDKTQAFADAVGMGPLPVGHAADAEAQGRPAFLWYEKNGTGSERQLSFQRAHENSARLASMLRSAAFVKGALKTDEYVTVGLVLARSAAIPLAQLATFKAGMTFVPCDVRSLRCRTILCPLAPSHAHSHRG